MRRRHNNISLKLLRCSSKVFCITNNNVSLSDTLLSHKNCKHIFHGITGMLYRGWNISWKIQRVPPRVQGDERCLHCRIGLFMPTSLYCDARSRPQWIRYQPCKWGTGKGSMTGLLVIVLSVNQHINVLTHLFATRMMGLAQGLGNDWMIWWQSISPIGSWTVLCIVKKEHVLKWLDCLIGKWSPVLMLC